MLKKLGFLTMLIAAALAVGVVGVLARDAGPGAPSVFDDDDVAAVVEPGAAAEVEADQEVTASSEEDECDSGSGEAGEFQLEIEGQRVEVERGTVSAVDGNIVTIVSPDEPPLVVIEADLSTAQEVQGTIEVGSVVEMEGTLANGLVAVDEIEVVCPEAEEAQECEPGEVAVTEVEDNGEVEVECEEAGEVEGALEEEDAGLGDEAETDEEQEIGDDDKEEPGHEEDD